MLSSVLNAFGPLHNRGAWEGEYFMSFFFHIDNHGSLQQFAFVQYGFDRNEHPVSINPHGNSKKSAKSFSRTKPSTIKMIKKSVDENKRPMKILRAIENDQGGVMQANSSCDLPRDRRQVYNIKQASKVKQENLLLPSCSSVLRTDTLACIMQKCKDTCLTSGAFIRSVEAAPEPMCVLCTDQQLKDMERFCTRSRSSVLSIDPTFNLGKFNVTPTTFHNLLVKNKQGKHPIISGPILIHQTKKFEPFHYFASTMVRLNPNLIGLRSFGTDGEPQLIKAFQTVFTGAVHLRCVNHLRQNVKDKLHALSLPQSSWKDFLGDIFGQQIGTQYEKGLVDSTSPDIFRAALLGLKNRWNNLELSYLPKTSTPQFYTWFCAYKADIIMNTVLPGIRGKAGWSSSDPREKFTTNSSEALNHVIKQEVQWKESKLPMLIEHLKAIVDQQESELEKAVVCRGEWRFTAEYKCLEVNEMAWFTMKADPKQKHMSKVKSFEVANQGDTSSMGVTMENPSLSVPFETVQKLLATISSDTLQCIWTKAKTLLATSGNVLKIPWSDDPRSRLVKSSSSTHPHVVNADHGDMYFCDEHCLMYKGYRVCSHVIAAAEDNGHLAVFLKGSCSKSKPNLAVIANEGLPAGAGRKGGCQKRKRKSAPPIESVSLRPCLQSQGVTSDTSSSSNASRQAPPCKYSCTEEMVEELNTSSPMVVVSSAPPISVAVSLPKSSNVSSSGQVVVGSGMNFNISTVPTVPVPMVASGFNTPSTCVPQTSSCTNPFTLKLKTNSIKICQACRQGYDGIHATLGLVVARSERKLIFNMVNQTQFLGRESNSHYHCLLRCLKTVSPQFKGSDLVIPDAVRAVLTPFQKVCLINFIQGVNLHSQ